MSVESDLVAELLGHAPLAALIGDRLSPDKVLDKTARPFIVYTVRRVPEYLLDGARATTVVEVTLQVWADTRASADEVTDALEAALAAATTLCPAGIPVDERQTISEAELDFEGNEVLVTLWDDG